VLGIAVFLVILDLGINAGQIHYGVRIDHLNLGGLTEVEAVDLLDRRGQEMLQTPVRFSSDGVQCTFLPEDAGWSPHVHRTVAAALKVGRQGSLLHAGDRRIRAWLGGVNIHWPDKPNRHRVAGILDRCERLARSAGFEIARWRMRLMIRQALREWPRPTFRIPLKHP
jgi:hypothetical protein